VATAKRNPTRPDLIGEDAFAEFLRTHRARLQTPGAWGGEPGSEANFFFPDEEELLACARGALTPARRREILARSARDPGLALALARARACLVELRVPEPRKRQRTALVAAAAALLLALGVAIFGPGRGASDPLSAFRTEVRTWASASTTAGEPLPHPRFGPLTGAEEARLDPGPTREAGGTRRWLLRGRVLDTRPALGTLVLEEPARLVLYRMADQSPVLERDLEAGELRLGFPEGAPLERGIRYGLEIRTRTGQSLAHADFAVSAGPEASALSDRVEAIRSLVQDEALRAYALGSYLIREGFYADAAAALTVLPAPARSPLHVQAERLALRLLLAE
jgi:hypothetical protein